MRRPGSSIGATLLLASILPAILLAVILSLVFMRGRFNDLESEFDRRGLALTRQLATAAEFPVFAANLNALSALLQTYMQENDVNGIVVLNNNGQVLARLGIELAKSTVARAISEGSFRNAAGTWVAFSAPIIPLDVLQDDPYASLGTRNLPARQVMGTVVIELSLQRIDEDRKQLVSTGINVTLLSLLGAALLAILLSRLVSRPIMRIKHAIDRIGKGEQQVRVSVDHQGDLRELELGVNLMAASLDRASSDLRQQVEEVTAQLQLKIAEAERANTAKSWFLAAASHDLRQPLHALSMFAAALDERIKYPEVRVLVDSVSRCVAALEGLFNALMDISRLDAGAVNPSFVHFRIKEWVDYLVAEYQPTVELKGLRLLAEGPDIAAYSDKILLETMLRNLIGNAIRYTDSGEITLRWSAQDTHLLLEVSDTGIGIKPEDCEIIFQEFTQLNNPERDRSKGLGLGLAIVDRIARIIDCTVSVSSTPGAGSTFRLSLPPGDMNKVVKEDVEETQTDDIESGLLVVVVDDEVTVRDGMQSLLLTWGCQVIAAESAEAVLASLQRAPDVIIADYRLREQRTGIEAITRLRAKWGPQIPALLVTGDMTAEALRHVHDSGFTLLHKPVRPAKLRSFLRKVARVGHRKSR